MTGFQSKLEVPDSLVLLNNSVQVPFVTVYLTIIS